VKLQKVVGFVLFVKASVSEEFFSLGLAKERIGYHQVPIYGLADNVCAAVTKIILGLPDIFYNPGTYAGFFPDFAQSGLLKCLTIFGCALRHHPPYMLTVLILIQAKNFVFVNNNPSTAYSLGHRDSSDTAVLASLYYYIPCYQLFQLLF